jgi:hypothetical protein
MHFLANFKKPELIPFDSAHPHKHFQLVTVKTRRGEVCEYQKLYLSCPDTGLDNQIIVEYLRKEIGIDESYVGAAKDEYWLEYQEGTVSVYNIDEHGSRVENAAIYSIDDPELQTLKRYCDAMFEYSITAEVAAVLV